MRIKVVFLTFYYEAWDALAGVYELMLADPRFDVKVVAISRKLTGQQGFDDAAGVSVSTGSACRAGVAQPSHVIMAMGRTEHQARGSLRISLGYTTTQADVDAFIQAFPVAYAGAQKAGLPSN